MRIRFKRNKISEGVAALSTELATRGHNSKLLRINNSRYRQRSSDLLINWGATEGTGLNRHAYLAVDKLQAFNCMGYAGVNTPDYTDSMEEALGWIDGGNTVVCRTLSRGSSGDGIVLASSVSDLVQAPLYTKYIKKKHEYRVHVFNEEVIDVARKARRHSVDDEDVNWQIRTHENGFVYSREGLAVVSPRLASLAVLAVDALHLDFGAVDIIYNEHAGEYYVLEVNTACGMEGTTVQRYADAIEQYIEEEM